MSFTRRAVALAALAIGLQFGLTAAKAADVPADIKARGKLLVAIDVSHPPYGMLDAKAKETGSDVETARLMAEDMGVRLEIVPVSGASRVPTLLSRKADVIISSFSITPERKKVVAYSRPYGVIPVVVLAPKDMPITSPADLGGKSVAIARGTTADIELSRAVKQGGLSTNIVRYEDEATTNVALATGQQLVTVTALSTANELAAQNPTKNLEVKLTLASYPMAAGLRKGDTELIAWVDGWVATNLENGKLNAIYERYFHQSLPENIPTE